MLYNGLTGAERTRYRSSTAFGDWEQGVDDTLTGNHWEVRGKLLGVRTLYADRPLLKHTYIVDHAVLVLDFGNGLGDVEAAGGNLNDFALGALWDHDFVQDNGGFLHGAQDVAHDNLVANLSSSVEVPFFLVVQRGYLDTAGDVAACDFANLGQRTLDTVEDTGQYARSQLDRHRCAGGFHIVAGTDACGFFIYLNGCPVLSHLNDFTDELLLAYTNDVGHIGVAHIFCNDQRTGNLNNFALAQYFHLLLNQSPPANQPGGKQKH